MFYLMFGLINDVVVDSLRLIFTRFRYVWFTFYVLVIYSYQVWFII